MPKLNATLSFLYDLQLFGMKAGLRNIRALLAHLGSPDKEFRSIHVAGTNGKGSTAAMIAAVLTASGYRTGLYTSPHLRHFSERIRIDGAKISGADVVRYTEEMRAEIVRTKGTFFEATTAMAFAYFADRGVDVAVVETGLGGRLDATNVLHPVLSLITGIGLDHTEQLGRTLGEIAREKAGIIKSRVPCLSGVREPAAARVIAAEAARKKAPLVRVRAPGAGALSDESLDGLTLSLDDELVPSGRLFISMAGAHQARNASLALAALGRLRAGGGFDRISPASVEKGFAAIRRYTGLRGRIDTLSRSPMVVADVGHNPDGIRTLIAALAKVAPGRLLVVFGVMKEKDCAAMADAISPAARMVVAVTPRTERARDCYEIAGLFHDRGVRAIAGGSVERGMEAALSAQRDSETLLVSGSHYVVGEAMDYLRIP